MRFTGLVPTLPILMTLDASPQALRNTRKCAAAAILLPA